MNKKEAFGYTMVGTGMVFLALSALNYIFRWQEVISPVFISFLFVAIGEVLLKKSRKHNPAGS